MLSLLLTCCLAATEPADLTGELAKIAASAPGMLGVRVIHVESGDAAAVNGTEWFPMMSVYKLPIVIHALRQAERRKLDLAASVKLTPGDRRPGFSPLASQIAERGPVDLTVRELISSIVRVSDNTASDALLRIVGGPQAVRATLTELRVRGVDVSRYELEFAADYHGVCCIDRMKPFSLEQFADAIERVSPAARRKAADAFVSDRRDSAQPDGMADLLARLSRGELLDAGHTRWLLDEMAEMHTRDTRLRAGLPAGTRASLRPGTSGETDGIRAAHNDNAIVVLPADRGHLIIAAFLKRARGTEAERDATLAAVARAAYRWAMER